MSLALVAVPQRAAAAQACGSFADVPTSNEFCADIEWLSTNGITDGYGDGKFHPAAPVSRQAMAAFLYRLANPDQDPLTCGVRAFPDVPRSSFCGDIAWLDGQAIANGYGDGGFHPAAPVSRQAMAAFLYRLANPGDTPAACTSKPFPDVHTTDDFCGQIAWLAGQKITGGYPDHGFHPADPVSRQAMAAFLHRLDPDLDLRAGYHVFAAGTFRVGTDIPAGTYRMKHGTSSCHWMRLSGSSGDDADSIEFGYPVGPTVVTLSASDATFVTDHCGVWTSDLSRISPSRTSGITNGIWIVGTDMAPGVWQAPGNDVCFWERLRGFSGTGKSGDEIIQSDRGVNPRVTIKATDKGFSTDHCGTWKRIG